MEENRWERLVIVPRTGRARTRTCSSTAPTLEPIRSAVVQEVAQSCIMNPVSARNSQPKGEDLMQAFNMVVERDPDTGLYVGYVPGWPGAHTQGASLDELQTNLREVVLMLLEDGDPKLESEFIGVQTLHVA